MPKVGLFVSSLLSSSIHSSSNLCSSLLCSFLRWRIIWRQVRRITSGTNEGMMMIPMIKSSHSLILYTVCMIQAIHFSTWILEPRSKHPLLMQLMWWKTYIHIYSLPVGYHSLDAYDAHLILIPHIKDRYFIMWVWVV